jgi:hypothetical protein
MRSWIAMLAMLTACGFSSSNSSDGGGGGDGTVLPDGQLCFGTFPKVCFNGAGDVPTIPAQLPELDVIEISTDFSGMCHLNNDHAGQYCVIVGAGFVLPITSTIRAYGSRPLVLLSTREMVINGIVDVSSNRGAAPNNVGAGADPASQCTAGTVVEADSGGYGGSFHGTGGAGGNSGTSNTPMPAAPLSAFPSVLRGGCRGANGARTNTVMAVAGTGGSGGGAVSLIGTSILIAGRINASGAGGGAGGGGLTPLRSGGGGGGSGGMIVLDTPTVMPGTGLLYANGGGGGEGGAGPNRFAAGTDGQASTAPDSAGAGGTGHDGGDGGAGSSGSMITGSLSPGPILFDGGGGAGGGGAGFIHAPGFTGDSVIAPPSLDLPAAVGP